jgi:hypothetical protein
LKFEKINHFKNNVRINKGFFKDPIEMESTDKTRRTEKNNNLKNGTEAAVNRMIHGSTCHG